MYVLVVDEAFEMAVGAWLTALQSQQTELTRGKPLRPWLLLTAKPRLPQGQAFLRTHLG